MRELESSGAFSCSEMKPAHVENETSQVTYVGESNSTPSKVRLLSREGVKNDRRDEQTDGPADWSRTASWPCHDPIFVTPSWFSAPLGLALALGSRPDYWRNELLYREGDIERHPGPKRAFSRGRAGARRSADHCATL